MVKSAYIPCLLFCLILAGCGSSNPIRTVTSTADFSLTSTPATVTLTAGAAGQQVSLEAVAMNGFTGTVSVAISGLPTGVTASPATLTLAPGAAQSVTLVAASTAVAGSATLTLTGTSGTLSHAATVAATIAAAVPAEDFSLTVAPATITLTAGTTGQPISVEAMALNGFTGTVTVMIGALPTGVTASPASLTLTPGTAQNVILTAAPTAAAGSATITVTGSSGSLSHTTTLAATIAAAPPPGDFSLTANPTTITLTAGAAGQPISVEAVPVNGFTGAITVTIGSLPAGVTASPGTLTLTPGAAQSVILAAAPTAAAGGATITLTGTSGALSHTAMVTATVSLPPAADFSLTSTPATVTLTAGAAGQQVSLEAVAMNGFTSTVSVAISGLPAGVTASPAKLTLTPGAAQSVTLTASSGAAAATAAVVFSGTSGALSHTAQVALTVQPGAIPDITTYHDDVARDGLNAQENILTPSNVNSTLFGKIGFDTVDGLVDAEPLYLANVAISGNKHNVLYVATENGSVYAFDADTATQIWKSSVLGSGETTSDDHGCGQITPQIGITSTPVIDRQQGPNGTIFVVGMSKDGSGAYHQRLHALDITTGAEISGSPTEISATYPGSGANSSGGNVVFDPGQYAERAALLLLNGNIYLTWTSHCDQAPYTGWVMAYSESTLKQTQLLNVTPNGSEGSIWMSGDGPAADSSGNIYFLDANGTFDGTLTNGLPSSGDYGNAMLKLSTSGGKLAVADYFETYNTIAESDADADLGSGGEMLLPPQTDMNGTVHQLVVGAGKDGNIYLADTNDMGGFTATKITDSYIYQIVTGGLSGRVFSTPAYFNGTVYYGAVSDNLKAFPMTNAKLATSASSKSATTFSYPGTIPSVSANGTQNGIVWTLQSSTGAAAVLHAYDATNLGNELYNSNQAANGRDSFGNGNKFITPMIVNGKVYVGTPTGVAIFGLLSQ